MMRSLRVLIRLLQGKLQPVPAPVVVRTRRELPQRTQQESKVRSRAPRLGILLCAAGLISAAVGNPQSAFAQEEKPPGAGSPFTRAIEQAQRRTVKILGAGIGREPGYASGVIISPDGQILTAQGIYLAGERLRVVLPDGTEHIAKIERRSQSLQTALLKIDAPTPDFFPLSEEPVARKGDWVLSVSNAFRVAAGKEPMSVNLGVVSLRTNLDAKRGTQDVPYDGEVLLIDAITSNPGAPGGALITADGRLAGMIGKIIEGKSTNTRLNYAVPADMLAKFYTGKLLGDSTSSQTDQPPQPGEKGEIGVRIFSLGGKSAPAFVDRVLPDSPAAKAGIRPDDLVVSLNGETIKDVAQYKEVSAALRAGVAVELVIKRKNELLTLTLEPEKDE